MENRINNVVDFKQQMIKRGDVWFARLNGEGSVQGSLRPVLIISNALNNTFAPTINIVPLSSKTSKMLPTHVYLNKELGLQKDSMALAEQIQTIDKKQLITHLGINLKEDIMSKIEKAIMIQLGIGVN